jgi:hypothetical protein
VRAHGFWRGVISVLIIGILSFVPAHLLYSNVSDSSGIHSLDQSASHRSASLSRPTDNYYGVPRVIYPARSSDLCVTFGFLTLDPAASSANFAILIGATQHGMQQLAALGKHGRYKSVSLVVSSNIGLSSIDIPVPLSTLDHGQASACESGLPSQFQLLRRAEFRTTQNIFVLGQPRSFPDDWYELNDSVTACAIEKIQDTCAAGPSHEVKLPSSLIMMTRDEDLPMKVGIDDPSKKLPFIDPLTFTITRPGWIILYTYWLAAMPFLLLITLGGYQYIRQRNVPKAYEVAFGVAATMVAILPLRAVLVPSSLPSLTRLDLMFSTEVALLVALSIVWVITWPPASPGTRPAMPRTAINDTAINDKVDPDAPAGE